MHSSHDAERVDGPADVRAALAHADIARVSDRLTSRTPEEAAPWPDARRAAVAAVLRVVDGPELLFIKRAELARDPWSGHVALPGGRYEPVDVSLEATAVRETLEELALDLTAGRVLGRLDDLAPRTRTLPPMIVRPFVAVVASDVAFQPSAEVADAFWVPLATLRAPESQTHHRVTINGVPAQFPAFGVHGHIVWGMTERIVRQLLSLMDD